jgi:hypothetical protein
MGRLLIDTFYDYPLKMEAIRSSETSFPIRSRWLHIPDDGILHSHRREHLISYILFLYGRLLIDTFGDYPLNMEAIHSSETSVDTSSTRLHLPEYCSLHL